MASLPIALQLYSVREELEQDFIGTLKAVKEMGYDGVEMAGLGHKDPLEVKKILEEIGLVCMSSHAPTDEMVKDGALARYKALGCDYVVIPWMSYGGHNQKLQENLDLIRTLADKAYEEGLTLLYHNHDFEFKKVDDKCVLDIIYDYDYIKANLTKEKLASRPHTMWRYRELLPVEEDTPDTPLRVG
ncbi:MAG: TIM barrel protein, partial [Clostridia bacterium]|nr:TIM barrel protein [Clostridia bacterium]